MGLKHWFATRREASIDNYYWSSQAPDKGLSAFNKGNQLQGAEVLDMTYTAWHALQYHTLRAMDFANNDRARGVVKLMRTEDPVVMQIHNMKVGDKKAMQRGPLESFSLVQKVTVYGSEMTVQEIPHHRIYGMYFWERQTSSSISFFMGDHENEFVAMADGIVAHYTEGKKRGRY